MIDLPPYLREAILRELVQTLLQALQERSLTILAGGMADGDICLVCRLPWQGKEGEGKIVLNVSNIARDVVFRDRDQPELGVDPAIYSPAERTAKIRHVVAHRMAVIDALMLPDEGERRRSLETLGQASGRLRVWEAPEDGEPKTVLWYENGEPVQ